MHNGCLSTSRVKVSIPFSGIHRCRELKLIIVRWELKLIIVWWWNPFIRVSKPVESSKIIATREVCSELHPTINAASAAPVMDGVSIPTQIKSSSWTRCLIQVSIVLVTFTRASWPKLCMFARFDQFLDQFFAINISGHCYLLFFDIYVNFVDAYTIKLNQIEHGKMLDFFRQKLESKVEQFLVEIERN